MGLTILLALGYMSAISSTTTIPGTTTLPSHGTDRDRWEIGQDTRQTNPDPDESKPPYPVSLDCIPREGPYLLRAR
jgi:hypothetical protein